MLQRMRRCASCAHEVHALERVTDEAMLRGAPHDLDLLSWQGDPMMARTITGIAMPLLCGRLALGILVPTVGWSQASAWMQTIEERSTLSRAIPHHQRIGQ